MEYSIYPSEWNSIVLFTVIIVFTALILVFMIILFAGFINASKNSKIILTDDLLEIKSFIYSKKILLITIQKDNISKINLLNDSEYKPRIKLNGIAVKGYLAGWFKLKNGKKAFLNVTKKDNVTYIPTNNGYDIMLSIKNADDFIKKIKQ